MLNKKCPMSGMPTQYAIGFGPIKWGFCSKKHRNYALAGIAAVVLVLVLL